MVSSIVHLSQLSLCQGIVTAESAKSIVQPSNKVRANTDLALGVLETIGAGASLGRLTASLPGRIAAYRIPAEPQSPLGTSSERYVMENHILLGCLIYALPMGLTLDEAGGVLKVLLPPDSEKSKMPEACSTAPSWVKRVEEYLAAFSFLKNAAESAMPGLTSDLEPFPDQGFSY